MRELTKAQGRLLDSAASIQQQSARDADSIKFMARSMVLATFPHSNPGDVPIWGRRNGDYSLTIQPQLKLDKNGNPESLGIPYGTIPRLILCWLTSEVVQRKRREVELGNSLSEFMRKLDILPTGGTFGSIPRVKKQMKSLFTANISITYDEKDRFINEPCRIADSADILWTSVKEPDQISLWKSSIVLSEKFFNDIMTRPVPVDMRALKALKGSSLQLDIYAWLTYRLSRVAARTPIPWEQLKEQFGSDYATTKQFAYEFKKALKKVQAVYKQANVEAESKYLILRPSRTSVSVNHGL
jgi:hypothetical protein